LYIDLLDLDLGSRGPSTVTLIALAYVATWNGIVLIWIVRVNDFPVNESEVCSLKILWILEEVVYVRIYKFFLAYLFHCDRRI